MLYFIANAVQQEIESRHLPPVDLKTFSGDPLQWPEFIENFKTRVHRKQHLMRQCESKD